MKIGKHSWIAFMDHMGHLSNLQHSDATLSKHNSKHASWSLSLLKVEVLSLAIDVFLKFKYILFRNNCFLTLYIKPEINCVFILNIATSLVYDNHRSYSTE
jgi:hypothetical protein